ncbi:hypothetical protein GCM10023193_32200 [Planotetraspora kaengkrachanensis]|uniref:Glycosyltransferase 2-like domain-containing protein n=2 Tax=Planotetraspora kaengkrachanensis TaxID=575193 RepID=A0A8J3PVQ2_9ACTN|nr:hypothetical protein Pka01_50040 [Planotetraspora kaengkrachanensis]
MRVSVIVPAYNGHEKLDLTLAGLADQSYPAHLIEVIVVDNGSEPPLRLPEIRHPNTRLIVCATPGRANARNAGLRAATGDVIHWLDSDVVLDRVAIEAHMRWHHLAPYLSVTSYLRFTTVELPVPADVIAIDDRAKLFEPTEPHAWIVKLVDSTDKLRSSDHGAFRLHVGGSTSVNARLIKAAGPMDEGLILGQDTEMGYRLFEAGAVFIPEPRSIGYHLGPTMRMREGTSISRVSQAFIVDRVPHYRWLRTHPNRQWDVPYVEVEIDATDASYEDVRASVDGILGSTVPDVSVVLLGPWEELDREPERRSPLKDPRLDLMLIRGHYAYDSRVQIGGRSGRAPYVLRLPAGWVPGEDTLAELLHLMVERPLGLLSVLLSGLLEGGVMARLERTAAFARARMMAREGEDLDAIVGDVFGSMQVFRETFEFLPTAEAKRPVERRTAYRARGEVSNPSNAEAQRLIKENELLKSKVAEWRDESKRWRSTAVEFRREIGSLKKQVNALKRARGIGRLTRRLHGLLREPQPPRQ